MGKCLWVSVSPFRPGLGLDGGLRRQRRCEELLGARRFQALDPLCGLCVEVPHLKRREEGKRIRAAALRCRLQPPLNLLKFWRQTWRWVVPAGLAPSSSSHLPYAGRERVSVAVDSWAPTTNVIPQFSLQPSFYVCCEILDGKHLWDATGESNVMG